MSEIHVFDELPRLLSGEADRDTVLRAAGHLRECQDCRDELVSAVVAHAALSSAVAVAEAGAGHQFGFDVARSQLLAAAGEARLTDPQPDLPDLSALFAQITAEGVDEIDEPLSSDRPLAAVLAERSDSSGDAASSPDADASGLLAGGVADLPRSRRAGWTGGYRLLVAAAVAGLAVGGGALYAGEHVADRSPSSQSVALAAFDKGTTRAEAKLVGHDEVSLDASALPPPGAGKLYEVWLTNDARSQMYAVGSLGPGNKATITVLPSLLKTYSAIEVSVQPANNSSYSGVSVLRGTYA